jgi:DNA-binding transcriptional MerR regulator
MKNKPQENDEMSKKKVSDDLVKMAGAVRVLGVTDQTVKALERKGELKSVRDYANRRLFRLRDLEALKRKRAALKG